MLVHLVLAAALAADVGVSPTEVDAEQDLTIRFTADAGWPDNAWVGIIPADVPHGSQAENDQHDVAYEYLEGRPSGTITLPAPGLPGRWDVRLHDGRGKEVASASFTVRRPDYGAAKLTLAPAAPTPLGALTVTYAAPSGLPPRSWIGVFPADAPHATGHEADSSDLQYVYLESQTAGTWEITAPEAPGRYAVRMYASEPDGPALAEATFTIGGIDAAGSTLKPDRARYLPGQKMEVTFHVPPGLSPKAWIGLFEASVPAGGQAPGGTGWMTYEYLEGNTDGTRTFVAPSKGGSYTLRLYDRDTGGTEITSVPITVATEVQTSDLADQLTTTGRIALYDIRFDTDKATLRPEATPTLEHIRQLLVDHPELRLRVEGHTDSEGPDSYNQVLSEKRALAVVTWLIDHGIAKDRLVFKGLGETAPVAPNDTEGGRALNRRVELVRVE